MIDSEFEAVYRQYFDTVFGYLLRLCRNRTLAEELTSDTFFKAMEAIDRFRGESSICSWLCQIAKNTYFSYLRSDKHHACLDELPELFDLTQPGPEERLLTRDNAQQAQQALNRLSEPYKEVFLLRVFGELSFRQIGTLFDKTENWACVVYHRARQKIRTELEES